MRRNEGGDLTAGLTCWRHQGAGASPRPWLISEKSLRSSVQSAIRSPAACPQKKASFANAIFKLFSVNGFTCRHYENSAINPKLNILSRHQMHFDPRFIFIPTGHVFKCLKGNGAI